LLASLKGVLRLSGQAVEWPYACSDDRSGSVNLTE
jgi:hypothetical protein